VPFRSLSHVHAKARLNYYTDKDLSFSEHISSIYIFKIGKSDRYINIRAVGRSTISATAGVALQTGPIAGKQNEAGTAQLQQQSSMSYSLYVLVYIDTKYRERTSGAWCLLNELTTVSQQ